MKDNFSKHSKLYAQFRPTYPAELFGFLKEIVTQKKNAWDCGTGNGQVAADLAEIFEHVYATDISEKQITHAVKKSNIEYKVEPAEQTSFQSDFFDLITIAQAIHWFDFEKFYAEVERVLKPQGVIAVIGYYLLSIDAETDKIINHLYKDITGPYWDEERKYLDELYQTIPFPYKEIECPSLTITANWSFDELIGYLNTWSAVQHYIEKNNKNPIDAISTKLMDCWGDAPSKKITFPVLLRVGRK
ncbi:class I SAM-dependent methyltransferase [Solitalea koreensis]|uniref:Methyltransferase domain-containing protein n=1 Tax=Solitalea koreensis TaxID=543615 RepID=A0A521AHN8_9SPHI|nr:class I SAM-dependent methyltransferase [Solitalea koreensis]SMO34332.1 Methyltransferase domain-containing protein [Solitalea koreensis]